MPQASAFSRLGNATTRFAPASSPAPRRIALASLTVPVSRSARPPGKPPTSTLPLPAPFASIGMAGASRSMQSSSTRPVSSDDVTTSASRKMPSVPGLRISTFVASPTTSSVVST